MDVIDRATISRYHLQRIKGYGVETPQALGWKSSENQKVRFAKLIEIGDLNGHSVLDVGCGHGDLCTHIASVFPDVQYTGIDQVEAFLQVASKKHKNVRGCRFFLGEFSRAELPSFDYVFASGVLAYRYRQADFAAKMITKMYQKCRKGVAFNMLKQTDFEQGILVTYKPQLVMQFCSRLADEVKLVQNYLDNDFTIFMYKH